MPVCVWTVGRFYTACLLCIHRWWQRSWLTCCGGGIGYHSKTMRGISITEGSLCSFLGLESSCKCNALIFLSFYLFYILTLTVEDIAADLAAFSMRACERRRLHGTNVQTFTLPYFSHPMPHDARVFVARAPVALHRPLAMLPSLNALRHVSLAATVAMCYVVIVVLARLFLVRTGTILYRIPG